MIERDLQDYLFDNPDILFPGQKVQEKAREYEIQGKRIDILFVEFFDHYLKGAPAPKWLSDGVSLMQKEASRAPARH